MGGTKIPKMGRDIDVGGDILEGVKCVVVYKPSEFHLFCHGWLSILGMHVHAAVMKCGNTVDGAQHHSTYELPAKDAL